jgi:hypothetical protein
VSNNRFPWTRIDPSLPPAEYDAAIVAKIKSRCRILENGCWEYLGTRNRQGYGYTTYYGKPISCHRLMQTIANGGIPDGHDVCHRCDFPPCCNPGHVFSATTKGNVADMIAKKRKPMSPTCPRGHLYAEHGRINGGKQACRICDRARGRIKAGWPEHLAYSAPLKQGHYPKGLSRLPAPPRRWPHKGPRSTHCRRGHEFTPETVYVRPDGGRQCWICQREGMAKRHASTGLQRPKEECCGPTSGE